MTEDPDGETLLVDLKELHALERSAGERLSSMIALEPGAQLSELLEWQRVRTEWHEDALRARLEESGEAPSTLKGLSIGPFRARGLTGHGPRRPGPQRVRAVRRSPQTAGCLLLLELAAERVDDEATACLARRHRGEQEEMAAAVASRWESFAAASGSRRESA